MVEMDTLSPWLAPCAVLLRWEENHGSAWVCMEAVSTQGGDLDGASLQIKSDLWVPRKQRCNKLFAGVVCKLLKMFLAWCSSPLLHALNFICSPTLSFKPPIKRRPKIISKIGAVDLEQGEGLESPFSSPHPPFGAKEVFLLTFREPVLPALTWKPRWLLVSHHIPQRGRHCRTFRRRA